MSDGPLSDVRILDLTRLLPGGFCTLLLADMGADVIKVEDTGAGDYVRWAPPFYGEEEHTPLGTRSALYLSLNRNKRSIRLDLKHEEGKKALLDLAKDADVLVESFRPGVLDRLGVGYDELAKANPALVYCPITGYGLDGPNRDRAGHDQNYLGLNGILGLTGDADGAPIQAAGQIADLGGGGLMAAVGILAALNEARRSGQGQVVDVSMTDGSLSWLAMVAGQYLCDGVVPKRGDLPLAGRIVCYRPYEAKDGWVSCGALEQKFWAAWCNGVGREDLIAHQFDAPGSDAHGEVAEIFKQRTREEWKAFNDEHDCCIEPILDIDEVLSSEQVTRARDGRLLRAARAGRGPPARLPSEALPHSGERAPARPRARGAHRRGAGRGRPRRSGGGGADRLRRGQGARRRPEGGGLPGMSAAKAKSATENGEMLRMGELAQASGVSAATIKHYLREGLLPEPVKTSRNMAYYPAEFVDRIRMIKQLQEERYMPLRVIKDLLDEDPDRAKALIELGDRMLERAQAGEQERISAAEIRHRYDVPQEVLDRLAELDVLTPDKNGYSPSDARIVEAISRFRAGGYDERIGFTVYDTLRYKQAMGELVKEEVNVLMERLAGEVDPDRAMQLIESGVEPLNTLMAALHTKQMVAELERRRGDGDSGSD